MNKHGTMVAKFAMTADRLDSLIIKMNLRGDVGDGGINRTDAEDLANEPGCCLLAGVPQHVMFVIGEVAAQGEDCLVWSHTFPG